MTTSPTAPRRELGGRSATADQSPAFGVVGLIVWEIYGARGFERRTVRTGSLIGAALGVIAFGVFGTATNADASNNTVVIHGTTFSEFFPDDICGPRASNVTFTFQTQVTHFTQRPDGTFNFVDVATGTYHVDFVDPSLADQDSQQTEAFHVALTPGDVNVASLQFHDHPTGLRIWEHLHLTVVDGNVVVDRDITGVTGCP
jgi:hypothetical protein